MGSFPGDIGPARNCGGVAQLGRLKAAREFGSDSDCGCEPVPRFVEGAITDRLGTAVSAVRVIARDAAVELGVVDPTPVAALRAAERP